MKNQLQHTDLKALFLNDVPMLDVRAPIEYQQGAFPYTQNIAILEDDERESIGIRYKEQGQDAAIALGAELVQGEVKEQRIAEWQAFIEKHPNGVLYCFRGGMRSQITQMWIKEQTDIEYPRVAGGYKAMRHFLIDTIERLAGEFDVIVLGGRTGSGKTRLLKKLTTSIDLEGLANHRGSAFGPNATPQPTQINFENQLAIEMLKHEAQGYTMIVVEDEGHNIGSIRVPIPLHTAMQAAKIVMMKVDDSERVEVSTCEYVDDIQAQLEQLYEASEVFDKLEDYLQGSLSKIQKRLGGKRYQDLKDKMQQAINQHKETGNKDLYQAVIQPLLVDYYDPMYDYQISKKQPRIVHTGDQKNTLSYLQKMES
ncbi:MAG: tRNA 2-selenouridine(34) synthase MnmH [Cocleimonas sp.]|nr:tRNA 2-selenouridine(34) synthase MnmH [Cocleimonas sp.]